MQVFRNTQVIPQLANGSVVTIGNFDGVHQGHRHVIARAHAIAKDLKLPLVVLTFEPHPRAVLKPDWAPFRLTPFAEKARRLATLEVDVVYALHFTKDYAKTSADDFITTMLYEILNAKAVVVGHDFAFGRDREAGLARLKKMGPKLGYEVAEVPAFDVAGDVCSSTRIRALLAAGELKTVAALMGAPYSQCLPARVRAPLHKQTPLKNGEYTLEIRYNAASLQAQGQVADGVLTLPPLPDAPPRVRVAFLDVAAT